MVSPLVRQANERNDLSSLLTMVKAKTDVLFQVIDDGVVL